MIAHFQTVVSDTANALCWKRCISSLSSCALVLLRKTILKTRAVYLFLKKSIFFYLLLGVIHLLKHITSVTVWLVPLKQIGLVGDVALRNNS